MGVNTAIASPNGGSVGIGFAIPANLAKPIIDQLREDGSVERGWLGVQIKQVTPDLAEALELDHPKAALVASEERRVGQKWVRSGRSRWSPSNKNKTQTNNH